MGRISVPVSVTRICASVTRPICGVAPAARVHLRFCARAGARGAMAAAPHNCHVWRALTRSSKPTAVTRPTFGARRTAQGLAQLRRPCDLAHVAPRALRTASTWRRAKKSKNAAPAKAHDGCACNLRRAKNAPRAICNAPVNAHVSSLRPRLYSVARPTRGTCSVCSIGARTHELMTFTPAICGAPKNATHATRDAAVIATDRQTDKQTDRQTASQPDRQTDKQTD